MLQLPKTQSTSAVLCGAALSVAALAAAPMTAAADEGGISMWLTGQFGSLAAAPQQPGWSFADTYYHASVSAGGDVAAARQVELGLLARTAMVNLKVNANVNARIDLDFVTLGYVFATPVLGGQFGVSMAGAGGINSTSINGTLTASVGNLTATRSGSISDERGGFADLFPLATLRWNSGVNNYMVYMTGDIPAGTYDSMRLANFGIGHGAIDGGAAYTYFDTKSGNEFSVATGLTGNFNNPSTDYTNGIDWHLDWGASKFLTKQWQLGAVGYFYKQLTADNGALPILGGNESQVIGVGPQIGYLFPIGKDLQGYVNVKAYWEFDPLRRADGWNSWVTFSISPAPPSSSTSKQMSTK
jgi:hypothetical protein